ncbi:hypothetical protein BH09PSE1_BH09PSE1_20530 [soil metagenome]
MTLAVLLAAGVLAWQTSVPAGRPDAADSAPALAEAVRPDLIYQVYFKAGDEFLGSPAVVGQFGREVRVEIPNRMRVVMIAAAPGQDGRSYTTVKMSVFRDNAWQPAKELSMNAPLASTPSFEHSVEGTPYRFVIMPRLIVPAAGQAAGI